MAVKKYSQYGFARKNTLHRDFSSVPEEAFLDAVYRWREYRECLAVEWEAAEEARWPEWPQGWDDVVSKGDIRRTWPSRSAWKTPRNRWGRGT